MRNVILLLVVVVLIQIGNMRLFSIMTKNAEMFHERLKRLEEERRK